MAWPRIVIRCPKATAGTTWIVRPRTRGDKPGDGRVLCPSCGQGIEVRLVQGFPALARPAAGHAIA